MTPPHYAMRSHIQQCRSIMRDHAMIWRKLCEDRLDSIAFIALRRAILWREVSHVKIPHSATSKLHPRPIPGCVAQREQIRRARTIIEHVAAKFGITHSLLRSTSRAQQVAWPRHVAVWCVRKSTALTNLQIGSLFRRTQTAVLHSIDVVRDRTDTDPDDRYLVHTILHTIP